MIQINLLPVRAKKRRENVRQMVSVYILSIFLMLSIMTYFWISIDRKIDGLERNLAKLEKEVQHYAKFDTMLKELKKKKEIIDKKRAIIKDLQKDRDRIVRILAMMSVEIPVDKVWFERLTQSSDTITIRGVAISNEAIAEFMRNLESSPFVVKGSVNLTHSKRISRGDKKLREFQLVYHFLPYSAVREKMAKKGSSS